MGQKVHPIGFRLGIYGDWDAHWFAKKSYGEQVVEDLELRRFLMGKLAKSEVAKIVIDKAGEQIKITIFSGRPGVVIGKKGAGIEALKLNLYKHFKKPIEVSVKEIRLPQVNAQLIARSIADQLERRSGVKRVMKKAGFAAMKGGAKGIKVYCSGRLGGAEIARTEALRLGSTPLHTLRSNIEFAATEARTTYGMIGVKVWVCKGEY